MFSQIHGLRGNTRNPGNGWWVIPVVRKEKKRWDKKTLLHVSAPPKQSSQGLFTVCACVPPLLFIPLLAHYYWLWLSTLLPRSAPLTLCPALSRTPVISWGRGNRHHGLSCHPSSCTWPLLSPRAPLLQRTTCQRERTDRGQVGDTAQEKERKKTRLLTSC